jgi:hypothetical protein
MGAATGHAKLPTGKENEFAICFPGKSSGLMQYEGRARNTSLKNYILLEAWAQGPEKHLLQCQHKDGGGLLMAQPLSTEAGAERGRHVCV